MGERWNDTETKDNRFIISSASFTHACFVLFFSYHIEGPALTFWWLWHFQCILGYFGVWDLLCVYMIFLQIVSWKDFCGVCTECTSGEIFRSVSSLAPIHMMTTILNLWLSSVSQRVLFVILSYIFIHTDPSPPPPPPQQTLVTVCGQGRWDEVHSVVPYIRCKTDQRRT